MIGERLRTFRKQKKLSQGDIEKRTGLMRCYISRVEQGHVVPSIETLGKITRVLEVRLYQFFYEGDGPPPVPNRKPVETPLCGRTGKEARLVAKFRRLFSRIDERDRQLLLHVAGVMANRRQVQIP